MEGQKREKRHFTDDFKRQMVELYHAGKSKADIAAEYDLTPSALRNWIKQYEQSGSFRACDNRSPEEQELIDLRKENRRLKMEVDVLKQAALIFAQK